jgi:hypothetical protein
MKRFAASVLPFVSGAALAHPGHGMPGWLHAHAADYALIALAVAVVAGLVIAGRNRK